jgi:hypothetical protein
MCDGAVVQRFQSDRRSLTIMDHPPIANMFDAGPNWFSIPADNNRPGELDRQTRRGWSTLMAATADPIFCALLTEHEIEPFS